MRVSFLHRQDELLARLSALPDAQARLSWVVDQATHKPPWDPALRTEAREIKGCSSKLWLQAEFTRGRCHFRADSESAILKALTSLLCDLYHGLPAAEVAAHEPHGLEKTGLFRSLTDRRREVLRQFRAAMKAFAEQHLTTGAESPTGHRPSARRARTET